MIRVATYNVHGFVGRDGRRDVNRIAEVIRHLGCDAVGLQEVDSRGARSTLDELEDLTEMRAVAGTTIVESDGEYGNALLTAARILTVRRHDLTIDGREPRGAIEARLVTPARSCFTLIMTHLGLERRERRAQVERLLEICRHGRAEETFVLAGDFNEWWPWSRTLNMLHTSFGTTPSIRTFPAWRPVLALDRIWIDPHRFRSRLQAERTALSRVASDHLPLVADLTIAPAPGD